MGGGGAGFRGCLETGGVPLFDRTTRLASAQTEVADDITGRERYSCGRPAARLPRNARRTARAPPAAWVLFLATAEPRVPGDRRRPYV